MRRLLAVVPVALTVAGLLNGCALKLDYRPELQAYIRHTEALARSYNFTATYLSGRKAEVDVRVADDFTYQAVYTADGSQESTEIVKDDVRAIQVNDPTLLTRFKAGDSGGPSTQTTVQPVTGTVPIGGFLPPKPVLDPKALSTVATGTWVEDPSGAYGILKRPQLSRNLAPGADQVGDALRVLADLDTYIGQQDTSQVVPYNPEAGYYFKDLDPFPAPVAGERRFDIALSPSLPGRSALNDSPEQRRAAIPQAPFFLSAAVYIRNGTVASIRESVSVPLRLKLPDQDLIARLADAQIKLPAGISNMSLDQQAVALDGVLNSFYASQSAPALVQRYVVVNFSPQGQVAPITLPPGATKASLVGIFDRGQLLGGGS